MFRFFCWGFALGMAKLLVFSGFSQGAQEPGRGENSSAGVSAPGQPATSDYYRRVAQRYFPAGVPGNAGEPNPEPRFSIKFKGGTPDELVKALRQAMAASIVHPSGPNVIISSAARNALVPTFELENVTLNDVFQTLNSLADSTKSGQWTLSGSSEPVWILNPGNPAIDPLTGQPIGSMGTPVRAREPKTCQVYAVSRYLTKLRIDDITTAIQTAWSLMPQNGDDPAPGGPASILKFHKDTELLIAVGTAEQLRLVNDVLRSLRQGMAEKEEIARIEGAENTKKKEDAK